MNSLNIQATIEIIAHRGYSAIAPENTLPAFRAALEQGAPSVEFDLQLSADRVPVVFHDRTLDRIAGLSDGVGEKTLEQLQQLDAGSVFAQAFAGTPIPTLLEVLDALQTLKGWIYFDVKPHCTWSEAEVDGLLQLLIDRGWQERCVLCSFGDSFLQKVRDRDRSFTLGYSVENRDRYQTRLPHAAADGNAVMISEYRTLLDRPSLVSESRHRGVDVVAWTVDSAEDGQRLTDIGIRRIITNTLLR